MQAAAQNLLGKETQVLVFGDLAKTGKQQFLAANVVPKDAEKSHPWNYRDARRPGRETDDQWSELLRCDEYLKNSKGYLAMTPLSSVAGWRIQYDQDPVKGIQLYFTPIKGAGASDPHLLPIGVAWNPPRNATSRSTAPTNISCWKRRHSPRPDRGSNERSRSYDWRDLCRHQKEAESYPPGKIFSD